MTTKPTRTTFMPDPAEDALAIDHRLQGSAKPVQLSAGPKMHPEGAGLNDLWLLTSGTLRFEYRNGAGTAVVALIDSEAVHIPWSRLSEAMARSRAVRAHLFKAYSRCISELLSAISDTALRQPDMRMTAEIPASIPIFNTGIPRSLDDRHAAFPRPDR